MSDWPWYLWSLIGLFGSAVLMLGLIALFHSVDQRIQRDTARMVDHRHPSMRNVAPDTESEED